MLRLILLAALALSPAAPQASAAPPSFISRVVPVVSIIGGLGARNRVYKNAEEFIQDRNAYFDRLRDTARQQLLEREVATLRPSQLAAYIKLVQTIEQERSATLQIAESLKGAARQEFQQRLQNAITSAILGSGPAQRLLGAMKRGIGSARDAVDEGLNLLSGGGGGALAEVIRIRRVAEQVNLVSSNIGGPTGAGLRRASDRILRTIDGVTKPIEADLRKVAAELEGLAGTVDALDRVGKSVSGSVTTRDVAIRLVDRESDNPTLDAITQILTRNSTDASNLRQQARDQLRQGFVVRCVAKASSMLAAIAELEGGPPVSEEQVVAACQTMTESETAAGEAGDEQDVHLTGTITFPYPTVAVHINELTLAFPSEGGEVSGTLAYTADLDLTLRLGDSVLACVARNTWMFTLTGVYDPNTGRLEGTMSGNATGVAVSGCEDSDFTPEALAGTWEGQFDPDAGTATGTITAYESDEPDEPSALPFNANRTP